MTQRKLYFGCAISGLPKEHYDAMVNLREEIFAPAYDVLKFCDPSTPDSEVYHHDIHVCVKSCDLLVAIVDSPSLGLGFELCAGLLLFNKPVLALGLKDRYISKLITGITHPRFEFSRYENYSDILSLLQVFEKKHLG